MNQIMNMSPILQTNNEGSSHSANIDFRQLLLAKINEAMNLNNDITRSIPTTQQNLMNTHAINKQVQTKSNSINGPQFNSIIKQAAEEFNVDEKLIHAVIKMESNYKPNAKSHAGAQGLMQLMPQTARGLGVTNAYDPKQNIFGGTKYLRQMLNQFNNNKQLALAAYNAGPGNVKKYGGIPPFQETQNYVRNVLNNYKV